MTKLTSKTITQELQDDAIAYVCGAKNEKYAVDFFVLWHYSDEDEETTGWYDDEQITIVNPHKPYTLWCKWVDLSTRECKREESLDFMTLQQAQGYMKRFIRWYMPRNSHNAVTYDNWQLQ